MIQAFQLPSYGSHSNPPPPPGPIEPRRRSFLAMLTTAPAVVAASCGTMPEALAARGPDAIGSLGDPDSTLIQACVDHARERQAYNDTAHEREMEANPHWLHYEAALAVVETTDARTMPGLLARARATLIEEDAIELQVAVLENLLALAGGHA